MKTILVTATIHGNETFGLKVLGVLNERQSSIKTIVAHPEAVAKRVRFIESDLNRSFNSKSSTLEERLAKSIMKRVDRLKPGIVVDIHTSVSDCGAVGIVTKYSTENHILAEMCGMKCLVIMPPSDAFIEQFKVPAIALEFGSNLRSDKLARTIADKIANISQYGIDSAHPGIPVYEMCSVIDKKYSGLREVKNLKYDKKLKGYPFLAGPDTYKDIGGFLLQRKFL